MNIATEVHNVTGAPHFAALDACHRDIHAYLDRLAALAFLLQAAEPDGAAQVEAAAIEAFFSSIARTHHAEEESRVFPPLLASGNEAIVAAVNLLQQDHGWIEENWLELAPQLRAIANGLGWVEPAEFQHAADVFNDLCRGHIALEESLVYPESKAQWAAALARRVVREAKA